MTVTRPTGVAVDAYLDAVAHPVRRADGRALATLMARLTGEPATMWGPSMVGFGCRRYRYESGREGDTFRVGFAPRAANLVLYLADLDEPLLERLGRHKRGAGCLYLTRLADVDGAVLEALIARSYAATAC